MRELFGRLTHREKMLVTVAAAFVSASVFYGVVFSPLMEKRDRWESLAARKRQEIEQFREMSGRYLELRGTLAELENRLTSNPEGASLLAQMESVARRLGLQDNITSMKPYRSSLGSGIEESSVEIRLEQLGLAGLVNFLAQVEENGHIVHTRRLRVKSRFDDPQLMDVTLQVSTLEAK